MASQSHIISESCSVHQQGGSNVKTIVVYRSKTGFAKQYAEWIAESLSADLFEAGKVDGQVLASYDNVIYGGGLYAVGINGVKLIKDNLHRLAGKKVVVFATGASPGRPEELDSMLSSNFTPEQLQQVRFFYLRGGFDASKLTLVDRLLMSMLKLKLKRKQRSGALLPDERGMLNAYDRPVSFARQSNIAALVSYVTQSE